MVASYNPMQSYYRPAEQLSVDTSLHAQHKYFEDIDQTLDDGTLMNRSGIDSALELSPPMVGSRRPSSVLDASLFSLKHEDWTVDIHSLPPSNPFADQHHSSNPFMRTIHTQQQQQHQHIQQQHQHQHAAATPFDSWPMSASTSAASGVATPLAQFDGLPAGLDSATAIFQRAGMQQTFHHAMGNGGGDLFSPLQAMPHLGPVSMPSTMPTTAAAPATVDAAAPLSSPTGASVPMQTSASTTSLVSQQNTMTGLQQHQSPQSPMLRSYNEMRRGDGIRKKNTRLDIPTERNLNTIDHLIARSTDEQEIKELKQQKRLLRNRQAALDSRQRKKMHTERLEDEKKQYVSHLAEMEQSMERMKLEVSELLRYKKFADERIEQLTMEKEDMICCHTIETSDLRKKISVLSNHVQVLEGAAASLHTMPDHHAPAASYAGAGAGMDAYGAMDGLSLGDATGSWEDMFQGMAVGDPQKPDEHEQNRQPAASGMQLVPGLRRNNNGSARLGAASSTEAMDVAEKPASQGGLLFMLFLVGAFVMSSRQTPSIPRVPEDVRVASATLLENVLKDAGVPDVATTATATATSGSSTAAAAVAAAAAPTASTMESMAGMATVKPSMLSQLSDELIQPTEAQTNEQVFSLSAAQYNGVMDQSFLNDRAGGAGEATAPQPSQGRRNLAEALAAMRGNSKAEVYTRSLLWDQIPGDVVRTFVKMVAEANTASPGADDQQE